VDSILNSGALFSFIDLSFLYFYYICFKGEQGGRWWGWMSGITILLTGNVDACGVSSHAHNGTGYSPSHAQ
jgi:hypothetical protein